MRNLEPDWRIHPGVRTDDKPGRSRSTDPEGKRAEPVRTRREEADFKREYCAGDCADGEEQGKGFRPTAGERHPATIFVPESKPFGNTQKQWQSNSQGSKDDMESERGA